MAISVEDRRRMTTTMSLDEMDTYSLLDPAGRSAYEDRWLLTHPRGQVDSAPSSFVPFGIGIGLLALAVVAFSFSGSSRNNPLGRRRGRKV